MHRQRCEYSLAELWDDPIVDLLMKSDRIDRDSVERLLAGIATRSFVPTKSCCCNADA
jgi:hypothetical protein